MRFLVVVREPGLNTLDYALDFEAPALPAIGSWLSVVRPDSRYGHSEDLIVRHVWWRLDHPETEPIVEDGAQQVGTVAHIQVECDPAIGPYSRDRWRDSLVRARRNGIDVPEFDVGRVSIREDEMPDHWADSRERRPARPSPTEPIAPGN